MARREHYLSLIRILAGLFIIKLKGIKRHLIILMNKQSKQIPLSKETPCFGKIQILQNLS